ncbi:MAG TPA: serine hydrolase [Flavobacteriales bacterium]|nr:serine hydrolase [Flavobacteriales bacterium]
MRSPFLFGAALLVGGLCAQKQPDLKKLDAYIAKAVADFQQPGLAVGIVQNGTLIWSKGYGKLDVAKPEAVDANSIFACASLSKAFTACAIGLLVDEGKVDWDEPVRTYLPEFSTADPDRTAHITVRDLLSHRSGWITFDGDLLWYGTDLSPKEILQRHAQEPFTYGFRERFGYSNLMFICAAQLIERVSGKTWDAFVTERILQPLGMTRTTVETAALAGMSDVALPHVHGKSMPYQPLPGADGATGINSCVNDLAKWDAMWAAEGQANGKAFLQPGTWTALLSPNISFEVDPEDAAEGKHFDAYAMGWGVEDRSGAKVISHSGGLPGFILNHAVVPEKDLAVIALGNGETYSVFAITEKVLDLYLGRTNTTDPAKSLLERIHARDLRETQRHDLRKNSRVAGTTPSLPLASYAGTYEDKVYGKAVITTTNGGLALSFPDAKELFSGALEHWHYDTFVWKHADPFLEEGYITFSFDADHRITGFKVDLFSPDFHFWKLDFKRRPDGSR